jgi:hypothetical protein
MITFGNQKPLVYDEIPPFRPKNMGSSPTEDELFDVGTLFPEEKD